MSRVQDLDFNVDLLRALLWQYDGATGLQSILTSKAAWYEENQSQFWRDWIRDVFDFRTANDFGCTVWGIILGIQLSIGLPGTGDRPAYGYGVNNRNYERGNYGRASSGTSSLALAQKRQLLQLRYLQLVSDGSVPFINFTLKTALGMGYVVDNYDMTMTYVFPVPLPSALRIMIEQQDLLPRPAAVGYDIVILSRPTFGYGVNYENYNNGTYIG